MTRIKELRVTYSIGVGQYCDLAEVSMELRYTYTPISEEGSEIEHLSHHGTVDDRSVLDVDDFDLDTMVKEGLEAAAGKSGVARARREEAQRDLLERCRTLLRLLAQRVPPVIYEIERQRLEHPFEVGKLEHTIGASAIQVWLTHEFERGRKEQISVSDLTVAQRRLVDSINTSVRRLAWEDLKKRLGSSTHDSRPQVFISYRKGHEEFAEGLARRLGQEGLVPWYDKWEILAGDSIPGKIEAAFRESAAFLPILTADYQAGQWAVEEMMTAITKRIDQGYRIVPIRLEECEPPELIRQLRYVDFSDQDPEAFEERMAEVIDGIYGLQQNPFR